MKIGTLSFEIQGTDTAKRMVLSSAQRREIIARVADKYSPHLLLCAGYSLADNEELHRLVHDSRISKGRTTLIVEVQTDRNATRASGKQGSVSCHRVYLIGPDEFEQPLGHQVIVHSRDLSGRAREKTIRHSRNSSQRKRQQ